jgi:hypothetical protein
LGKDGGQIGQEYNQRMKIPRKTRKMSRKETKDIHERVHLIEGGETKEKQQWLEGSEDAD